MTKRRGYTKRFKEDAVRMVTEQGHACADAARNLGIHANLLGKWVRRHREVGEGEAFPGNGRLTKEGLGLRRARARIRQLETDQEIPRKAMAFFTQNPK